MGEEEEGNLIRLAFVCYCSSLLFSGGLLFCIQRRGGRGGGYSGGNKRVFVGNLSWDVSWQDLKDHMRQAGEVLHADVIEDPSTGRSKGILLQCIFKSIPTRSSQNMQAALWSSMQTVKVSHVLLM